MEGNKIMTDLRYTELSEQGMGISVKVNSTTKLQKLDYDLVKKYVLREHQHGVETKNIPYERRK